MFKRSYQYLWQVIFYEIINILILNSFCPWIWTQILKKLIRSGYTGFVKEMRVKVSECTGRSLRIVQYLPIKLWNIERRLRERSNFKWQFENRGRMRIIRTMEIEEGFKKPIFWRVIANIPSALLQIFSAWKSTEESTCLVSQSVNSITPLNLIYRYVSREKTTTNLYYLC